MRTIEKVMPAALGFTSFGMLMSSYLMATNQQYAGATHLAVAAMVLRVWSFHADWKLDRGDKTYEVTIKTSEDGATEKPAV